MLPWSRRTEISDKYESYVEETARCEHTSPEEVLRRLETASRPDGTYPSTPCLDRIERAQVKAGVPLSADRERHWHDCSLCRAMVENDCGPGDGTPAIDQPEELARALAMAPAVETAQGVARDAEPARGEHADLLRQLRADPQPLQLRLLTLPTSPRDARLRRIHDWLLGVVPAVAVCIALVLVAVPSADDLGELFHAPMAMLRGPAQAPPQRAAPAQPAPAALPPS